MFVGLLSHSAWGLDLFDDGKPQATSKTCQSYSAVLALAAKKDSAFPIGTFKELRDAEKVFRGILESFGNPYLHSNWPKAMEVFTGDKYTLDRKYFPKSDIVGWMKFVKDRTKVSTSTDLLLADISGRSMDVVLTSVKTMGGSNYSSGHVISVVGMVGNGLNSSTKIAAFNSAIKDGGSIKRCPTGITATDATYSAGLIVTNDFTLNELGGVGFAAFTLRKK